MSIAAHKRFLLISLFSVILWWPSLRTLVRLAIYDDDYSYILLVLVVSVILICLERWPVSVDRPSKAAGAGITLLAVFALYPFEPRPAGSVALTISIFLWVLFLAGLFVTLYGWPAFSRMRFPFLFSFLAIPPTTRVINALTSSLQWASADATYALFKLFRIPVVRDGLLFSFSKLDILVAEECSSIRSSTILVVTTIVLAHLFLRTASRQWIAVLVSVPVAIFKNGVRIFILSVLAEYVSLNWLDSRLHHQGGIIFLALGLLIMGVVIWLLSRSERNRARSAG